MSSRRRAREAAVRGGLLRLTHVLGEIEESRARHEAAVEELVELIEEGTDDQP